MKGISKVIDELGLLILAKEIELDAKQKEIDELNKKVKIIESYLDAYSEIYDAVN